MNGKCLMTWTKNKMKLVFEGHAENDKLISGRFEANQEDDK